jgi:hypothetical protein
MDPPQHFAAMAQVITQERAGGLSLMQAATQLQAHADALAALGVQWPPTTLQALTALATEGPAGDEANRLLAHIGLEVAAQAWKHDA